MQTEGVMLSIYLKSNIYKINKEASSVSQNSRITFTENKSFIMYKSSGNGKGSL